MLRITGFIFIVVLATLAHPYYKNRDTFSISRYQYSDNTSQLVLDNSFKTRLDEGTWASLAVSKISGTSDKTNLKGSYQMSSDNSYGDVGYSLGLYSSGQMSHQLSGGIGWDNHTWSAGTDAKHATYPSINLLTINPYFSWYLGNAVDLYIEYPVDISNVGLIAALPYGEISYEIIPDVASIRLGYSLGQYVRSSASGNVLQNTSGLSLGATYWLNRVWGMQANYDMTTEPGNVNYTMFSLGVKWREEENKNSGSK